MRAHGQTWMSVSFPIALVAGAFALAGGAKKGCMAVQPEEPICSSAKDCEGMPGPAMPCAGAWDCVLGECQFACKAEGACTSDSDCKAGEYCEMGPIGCGPCPPGQTCICEAPPNGTCKPKGGGGGGWECSNDSDCAPGKVCQIQMCTGCACPVGQPCDCPPPACYGTCNDPPPPPKSCIADSDCPVGQSCECGSDPSCPFCDVCLMQCMPIACLADKDCKAGEVCIPGPCLAAPCGPDWCPPCYGACQVP